MYDDPVSVVALVKMARVLFARFVADLGLDQPEAERVDPGTFLTWLKDTIFLLDRQELADEADVSSDVFDALEMLAMRPEGANQLAGIWHRIALGGRPPLEVGVHSLSLIALIHWEDGNVTPLSQTVPALLDEADDWTDGSVASILSHEIATLVGHIVTHGLDTLHDKGVACGDRQEGWQNFIGMVARLHTIPGVPEHWKTLLVNWAKLTAMVLAPDRDLPPEVQAQVDAARLRTSKLRKLPGGEGVPGLKGKINPPEGGFQGGFNVGG